MFRPMETHLLKAQILELIQSAWTEGWSESHFDAVALEVVRFQLAQNPLYRRFSEQAGKGAPRTWWEARAVPTDVFKSVPLTCFPVEQACRVFRTSGTTAGQARGAHYFPELSLYDAAMRPGFERFLLPERRALPMLALLADPVDVSDSSLSYMVNGLMQVLEPPVGQFFLHGGRLHVDALLRTLEPMQASGQPVMLLGTAFAFVWWLEALQGRPCPLPPGSRLMETGGFKGKVEAIERSDLYQQLSRTFDLPPAQLVAEYGMTELSSQLYDNALRNQWEGRGEAPRRLVPPPWLKVTLVDPVSLEALPEGSVGLVRFFDLANLWSVASVQTSDLGRWSHGGLELLGRASGADIRGCSLAIEELRQLGGARG